MKITKKDLKRIIREELTRSLSEDLSRSMKYVGRDPDAESLKSLRDEPVELPPEVIDVDDEPESGPDVTGLQNAPLELDSWVGLPKDDVYMFLNILGAEPNKRNPPWCKAFDRNDPIRVKFREWYRDRKQNKGRTSPAEDAMSIVAQLQQAYDEATGELSTAKLDKVFSAGEVDAADRGGQLKGMEPKRVPYEREEDPQLVPDDTRPLEESRKITGSSLKKIISEILRTDYR